MPQPTSRQVHVNRPLTNISIAFMNAREDFIADQVFPMIPVSKQSDLYFQYKKDAWFRSDAQKRGPGQESAGSGYELETGNYYAHVYALHKDVSDQERANSDDPLDADKDATEFVTEQLLLKREKVFQGSFFVPSIWTGSTTGGDITPGTLWSASGSDPIKDVREQSRAMKKKTGRKPNVLVVSGEVHDKLVDNAAVLARIAGGSMSGNPALVTKQLLAMVFEVEKYVVAEAIENTAKEGQTFAGAAIYGKHAMLCYAEQAPGLRKPSAGYIFGWSGLLGGSSALQMSRFRMDSLKSDRVEGEMSFDMKQVAADLGVFFANVIT